MTQRPRNRYTGKTGVVQTPPYISCDRWFWQAGNSTSVVRPEARRPEGSHSPFEMGDEERRQLEESFTSDGETIEPEAVPSEDKVWNERYGERGVGREEWDEMLDERH